MLRECHRVLKRGGRIAGYVIHTPAGLSAARLERAAELGPSAVAAPASQSGLLEAAGFEVLEDADVTGPFKVTAEAIVRARQRFETPLRAADGDAIYEEEQLDKENYLVGIGEGLLLRSLLVAVRD